MVNDNIKKCATKTRVVLVEDHTEYREVIEIALRKTDDIELVDTFGAAEVALRRLQQEIGFAKPDVILLDLNLPGIGGLDAIPLLLATTENLKIVVLTQSNQEADVMRAMTLGAVGYLLKSATVSQIVEAIRSAVDGDVPLDAGVAKYVLSTLKTVWAQRGEQDSVLTEREIEILHLIADGLTKKQIATQLSLSTSTVSTHAVHIFEKLSVQNAPAAVAKAFRMGLISPE